MELWVSGTTYHPASRVSGALCKAQVKTCAGFVPGGRNAILHQAAAIPAASGEPRCLDRGKQWRCATRLHFMGCFGGRCPHHDRYTEERAARVLSGPFQGWQGSPPVPRGLALGGAGRRLLSYRTKLGVAPDLYTDRALRLLPAIPPIRKRARARQPDREGPRRRRPSR